MRILSISTWEKKGSDVCGRTNSSITQMAVGLPNKRLKAWIPADRLLFSSLFSTEALPLGIFESPGDKRILRQCAVSLWTQFWTDFENVNGGIFFYEDALAAVAVTITDVATVFQDSDKHDGCVSWIFFRGELAVVDFSHSSTRLSHPLVLDLGLSDVPAIRLLV